jgi:1,4-alpha-glucan branching enzyme
MPFTKKALKGRPLCKVRFKLEADQASGCDSVYLVGTFNDWDDSSLPMKQSKNGSFSLEIELPVGEKHSFRYLCSDGRWLNDNAADGYEYCAFAGEDNSVILL